MNTKMRYYCNITTIKQFFSKCNKNLWRFAKSSTFENLTADMLHTCFLSTICMFQSLVIFFVCKLLVFFWRVVCLWLEWYVVLSIISASLDYFFQCIIQCQTITSPNLLVHKIILKCHQVFLFCSHSFL